MQCLRLLHFGLTDGLIGSPPHTLDPLRANRFIETCPQGAGRAK